MTNVIVTITDSNGLILEAAKVEADITTYLTEPVGAEKLQARLAGLVMAYIEHRFETHEIEPGEVTW